MEENVENYFIVFLLGLGSMIAFHNLIISIRKYFTRNYGKVSDMLRIICNYGNLWRFLLSLGYFMTPSDVTPGPCKALGIYRLSSEKKDLWLGIAFLLIQTSLVVPELVLAIPQMNLRPTNLNKFLPSRYCDLIFGTNYYRIWTTIIFGFVIMFYLVARISYLAKNRRRCTIANVPSTAKRPINLSTIYWSLALTFLTFMLMWLSSSLDEKPDKILLLSRDHSIIGLTYKNLLYILISYVITHLDIEKRKDIIFYNCGGNGRDGGENVRNSSNKLDGEAWVICSKKEKKKDNTGEAENNETQV
ncbi:2448_t:CDS:2 [Rhizophagus irregularis]|nr:2448_t:CDS:2 [Rhizophagus irregularis]